MSVLIGLMVCALSFAQTAASANQHIEKRYNIFFRIIGYFYNRIKYRYFFLNLRG